MFSYSLVTVSTVRNSLLYEEFAVNQIIYTVRRIIRNRIYSHRLKSRPFLVIEARSFKSTPLSILLVLAQGRYSSEAVTDIKQHISLMKDLTSLDF